MALPDLSLYIQPICAKARVDDLSEDQATADAVIASNAAAISAECDAQLQGLLDANAGQYSKSMFSELNELMRTFAKTLS